MPHSSITFFILTDTSLYRATWRPGEPPEITKIAMRPGRTSLYPVGSRMRIGKFIGLRQRGVSSYTSETRNSNEARSVCFLDNTSGIIGLFLDENAARLALNGNGQLLDLRYRRQTEEVIALIDTDHPVFVILPNSFVYPQLS